MYNKGLHLTSFILVVVGGLNWGLVGLFQFNLVEAIFGYGSAIARIIYVLVGLAAIYLLAMHKHDCKTCGMASHPTGAAGTGTGAM
jgi:uncharacterized membrane protein YuzA (DUF378 family)